MGCTFSPMLGPFSITTLGTVFSSLSGSLSPPAGASTLGCSSRTFLTASTASWAAAWSSCSFFSSRLRTRRSCSFLVRQALHWVARPLLFEESLENSSTGLYCLQQPHQCRVTPSTTLSGWDTFRPRVLGSFGAAFSASTSSGVFQGWRFRFPVLASLRHSRQRGW